LLRVLLSVPLATKRGNYKIPKLSTGDQEENRLRALANVSRADTPPFYQEELDEDQPPQQYQLKQTSYYWPSYRKHMTLHITMRTKIIHSHCGYFQLSIEQLIIRQKLTSSHHMISLISLFPPARNLKHLCHQVWYLSILLTIPMKASKISMKNLQWWLVKTQKESSSNSNNIKHIKLLNSSK